jgi:hypothetical protein
MTLGSAGERPRLQDRLFHPMARRFAPTAAQGARPVLFAATSPGVRGGDFIGPGGWFGVQGIPDASARSTGPATTTSLAASGKCRST